MKTRPLLSNARIAWKVLLVSLLMTTLVACGKSDHNKNAERFPGFNAVSDREPAASFLVDTKSIRRENDGVQFQMVRVLAKGYVVQSAFTDCIGLFQAAEGVQYNDEGVSENRFPGDKQPIVSTSIPGVPELIRFACAKANEARGFSGEFDNAKALEILYGKTIDHAEVKVAVRSKMQPPSTLNLAESFAGKSGLATPILSHSFLQSGVRRHILLTSTIPQGEDYECHACAVLVSGATFIQTQDRWSIESEYPYLAEMGVYGRVETPEVVLVDAEKPMVLFKGSDMHGGIGNEWRVGYLVEPSGLKRVVSLAREGEKEGQSVSVSLATIPTSPAPYDLKATFSVTEIESKVTTTSEQILRFSNGKYVVVSSPDKDSKTKARLEPESGTNSARVVGTTPGPASTKVDAPANAPIEKSPAPAPAALEQKLTQGAARQPSVVKESVPVASAVPAATPPTAVRAKPAPAPKPNLRASDPDLPNAVKLAATIASSGSANTSNVNGALGGDREQSAKISTAPTASQIPITRSSDVDTQGTWSGTMQCGRFQGAGRPPRSAEPYTAKVSVSVVGRTASWTRGNNEFRESLSGVLDATGNLDLKGSGAYLQTTEPPWTTTVHGRVRKTESAAPASILGQAAIVDSQGVLRRACVVQLVHQ